MTTYDSNRKQFALTATSLSTQTQTEDTKLLAIDMHIMTSAQ